MSDNEGWGIRPWRIGFGTLHIDLSKAIGRAMAPEIAEEVSRRLLAQAERVRDEAAAVADRVAEGVRAGTLQLTVEEACAEIAARIREIRFEMPPKARSNDDEE